MNDKEFTRTTDESNDHKYYIVTPQIVWALSRTPYDYALWNVIKMIAGDNRECFLTTDDLATLAMMSAGKVSDSRKYLISVGLLQGEVRKDPGYPQPVWHLRIPDIWEENIRWRKGVDGLKERVALKAHLTKSLKETDQLRAYEPETFVIQDMHVKSLHNMKPSQYEEGGTQNEEGGTQNETKNNQSDNQKEEPPAQGSKNSDYLSALLLHHTGKEAIAEPDDFQKHFGGYRDPVLKSYNDEFGLAPNQGRKQALIDLANEANFDLQLWLEFLPAYNRIGGNPYNIELIREGYWRYVGGAPIRQAVYPDSGKKTEESNIVERNGKTVLVVN